MKIIQAVPTNIITGFLGVGKTTAINHLLRSKPHDERWAILVNEFGEVGVDASLLSGQNPPEKTGVFIKEVPGGCMCCTSGLPMQVALNQLLTLAKPQRLLIEPTGLGHPAEVLDALSQPHYHSVLSLCATITLVDARHFSDARYISHDTFVQQLDVADVIVANKTDLYTQADHTMLASYCQKYDAPLHSVEQARIDWHWLKQKSNFATRQSQKNSTSNLAGARNQGGFSLFSQQLSFSQQSLLSQPETNASLPPEGYIKTENEYDDFASVGWRFSPKYVFSRQKITLLFMATDVERAKGVFITDDGVFGYNKTAHELTEIPLDDSLDSRLEIIHKNISQTQRSAWQNELLAAAAA